MKKQVVSVSIAQSAKVVAGIYLLISVPAVLIFAAVAVATGQPGSLLMLLLMPLLYAGLGFLGTAISAWIYNIVAARVGGLEFTTVEVAKTTSAAI